MIWDPKKEPFWAFLLAWVLNLLSGRFIATGREEAREEQREASEELKEKFSENDSDDRTLDDALGGLRARRKRSTSAGSGNVPKPGRTT